MSAFNAAYRAAMATRVKCPKCGAVNLNGASDTVVIDQTGTLAECSICSFARPIAAFLPKDAA